MAEESAPPPPPSTRVQHQQQQQLQQPHLAMPVQGAQPTQFVATQQLHRQQQQQQQQPHGYPATHHTQPTQHPQPQQPQQQHMAAPVHATSGGGTQYASSATQQARLQALQQQQQQQQQQQHQQRQMRGQAQPSQQQRPQPQQPPSYKPQQREQGQSHAAEAAKVVSDASATSGSGAAVDAEIKASIEKYKEDANLVFELALLFYRTNKGTLNFDYDTKIDLAALYKQSTIGPYDPDKHEAPGFFDFVGKDRVAAWKALAGLDEDTARAAFCELLKEKVPEFAPWFDARLAAKAERERRERLEKERLEREKREKERLEKERQERERLERERARREQEAQQALLAQQQRHHQQLARQQQRGPQPQGTQQQPQQQQQQQQQQPQPQEAQHVSDTDTQTTTSMQRKAVDLPIPVDAEGRVPADKTQMLASQEYLDAFKEAMRGNADSEAVVSNGEVLTVRVPKPFGGNTRIVWQFCTEDMDISFGVDFETKAEDGAVSCETVLPIMRTNAHTQVVTGSHVAQNAGTWLLRFDNSYSYFRSKTVFYRVVCYNI